MKDINALLWQEGEDQSCETEQAKNKMFDEFCMKYLQPNTAAFRENYHKNCYVLNTVEYDACTLDFIPVADKKYCIVDMEDRCLCGTITTKPYVEADNIEKSIFSLLIADEWDIRKVMPVILEKRWRYIYFVLNREAEKFASFFKLEEFPAALPPNVKFFATTEEMRQYFLNNHDAYLPRKIIAPESEKYEALFKEIHHARVQSEIPSNNVFLSVCIPTFNRGKLALKAVKTALSTEFDAEIEVFVSDNASTIEKEEYEEIANMKDSRLRYYRAEENRFFRGNVINCLKKARGHFALFLSDEDPLVVENLGTALDWLIQRMPHMGGCLFNGSEGNPFYNISQENVFDVGVAAIMRAHHTNYVSGLCLNLDHIKDLDLLAQIERYKCNNYFIFYPHCVVMALLAVRFNVIESPILLWEYGEQAGLGQWNGLLSVAMPESRMQQEQGSIEIMAEYLSGEDLTKFFLERIHSFFRMVSSQYKWRASDEFKTMYRWIDIWTAQYKCCLQILRDLEGKIEDITSVISQMDAIFLYWQVCNREQRLHTPEENLLPCLQAQVAKYYYSKGTPIEDIDFKMIEKELEGWVQDFLAKRT